MYRNSKTAVYCELFLNGDVLNAAPLAVLMCYSNKNREFAIGEEEITKQPGFISLSAAPTINLFSLGIRSACLHTFCLCNKSKQTASNTVS